MNDRISSRSKKARLKISAVYCVFAAFLILLSCDNAQEKSEIIAVTGIQINKTETVIEIGGSEKLYAAILPSNAASTAMTWRSDNDAVAEVSEEGLVTGVAAGNAAITVKSEEGNFEASCLVVVASERIAVTGASLDKTSLTLQTGETSDLHVSILPIFATNQNVTWSSSNSSLVTVDQGGKVAAAAEGSATVTVTTEDGGFSASCAVTVPYRYSVTYYGNGNTGGAVPVDSGRYTAGESFTVKDQSTLVKSGYSFECWNSESTAAASGSWYLPGRSMTMLTGGLNLYAIWSLAKWGLAATTAPSSSEFTDVSLDRVGYVYSVGSITGMGNALPFVFGSQSVTGYNSTLPNALIIKTDPSGNTLWARSTMAAAERSVYNSVAVDKSGNAYAVGYQYGTDPVQYGTTVSVKGNSTSNSVIVKYDSNGNALWARSVIGSGNSMYNSAAVDSDGNVYAAGYQNGNSTFDYGNSKSAQSASVNTGNNAVVVKYDKDGNAQWAMVATSTLYTTSTFNAVIVDGDGNVYAAGNQASLSDNPVTFGLSTTKQIIGVSNSSNAVIVKLNTTGEAKSISGSVCASDTDSSSFSSIAYDGSGGIYAAGYHKGTANYTYNFGTLTAKFSGNNALLVKYDTALKALWGDTPLSASGASVFLGVAAAGSEIYAAGYQNLTGSFWYGSEEVIGSNSGLNSIVIKYKDEVISGVNVGTPQWGISTTVGTQDSRFNSVAAKSTGVYVAGNQKGLGPYEYTYNDGFNPFSLNSYFASNNNAVLLKFAPR